MTSRWQKNKRIQSHHADDWLMTYADMITLLLCFFAIIIIMSAPKKNTQAQIPAQPVVTQPQNPALPPAQPQILDIFPGNLPFHTLDEADDPEPLPVKSDAMPATIPVPVTPEISVPQQPTELSLPKTSTIPEQPISVEQKGDRVTTFELNSAAFFDSGSATLSNTGMLILQDVAANLKSDKLKDYHITVEGHTDDTPIHTLQFPSNWELSTARASAVVQFFLEQGIPAQRLRAAGYADTFPKVPNRDSNGNPIQANRAENRRVVINLEKVEKN